MINRFLRLGDSRPQTPPDAAACDSGAKIREWMLQMKNTLNLDPSKDTTEQNTQTHIINKQSEVPCGTQKCDSSVFE